MKRQQYNDYSNPYNTYYEDPGKLTTIDVTKYNYDGKVERLRTTIEPISSNQSSLGFLFIILLIAIMICIDLLHEHLDTIQVNTQEQTIHIDHDFYVATDVEGAISHNYSNVLYESGEYKIIKTINDAYLLQNENHSGGWYAIKDCN